MHVKDAVHPSSCVSHILSYTTRPTDLEAQGRVLKVLTCLLCGHGPSDALRLDGPRHTRALSVE